MSEEYSVSNCRSCGSDQFVEILSLGDQYVTNFIETNEDAVKCPLDLILCDNCKLLQMRHNAPPEAMWSDQYWYKSGISTTLTNDLKDIVEKCCRLRSDLWPRLPHSFRRSWRSSLRIRKPPVGFRGLV